jgi:hypothetical protein
MVFEERHLRTAQRAGGIASSRSVVDYPTECLADDPPKNVRWRHLYGHR